MLVLFAGVLGMGVGGAGADVAVGGGADLGVGLGFRVGGLAAGVFGGHIFFCEDGGEEGGLRGGRG